MCSGMVSRNSFGIQVLRVSASLPEILFFDMVNSRAPQRVIPKEECICAHISTMGISFCRYTGSGGKTKHSVA